VLQYLRCPSFEGPRRREKASRQKKVVPDDTQKDKNQPGLVEKPGEQIKKKKRRKINLKNPAYH